MRKNRRIIHNRGGPSLLEGLFNARGGCVQITSSHPTTLPAWILNESTGLSEYGFVVLTNTTSLGSFRLYTIDDVKTVTSKGTPNAQTTQYRSLDVRPAAARHGELLRAERGVQDASHRRPGRARRSL